MTRGRAALRLALALLALVATPAPGADPQPAAAGSDAAMAQAYSRRVDMRLDVPPGEQRAYATRLQAALTAAGLRDLSPQYFLLVDRNPFVQAILVYSLSGAGAWQFVGASPVSTGQRGGFEYFLTPLGVFAHTLANMDFRAEGTYNEKGIRGYGAQGLRVFDFGWVEAERTWGAGGRSPMRLQVHATDPDRLESQLGRPRSKGCIRIPASLNRFIDQYGIIDAEYERAVREGRPPWVLRPDREPVAEAGKYLVVIDSGRKARPAWSPWPPRRDRKAVKPVPANVEAVNPRAAAGSTACPA